jgi:hypothetical protein
LLVRHRGLLAVFLALATLLAGCKNQPQVDATQAEARRAASAGPAPEYPFPQILSATPGTLTATDGRTSVGLLRVSYAIPSPERVTQAYLELYNPVAQSLARIDVPIQAQGEMQWNVGADVDLGPAVRLRADCPRGYTEWVMFGRYRYPASSAQSYINNVTPKYIRFYARDPQGLQPTATNLDLYGVGLERGCKVQASVNNQPPQELYSGLVGPNHLMAQLPWVGEVGTRDLELKLVIRGQGFATENIFHITVNDE